MAPSHSVPVASVCLNAPVSESFGPISFLVLCFHSSHSKEGSSRLYWRWMFSFKPSMIFFRRCWTFSQMFSRCVLHQSRGIGGILMSLQVTISLVEGEPSIISPWNEGGRGSLSFLSPWSLPCQVTTCSSFYSVPPSTEFVTRVTLATTAGVLRASS